MFTGTACTRMHCFPQCTCAMHSAHKNNLSRTHRVSQDATRVFVVSPPPEEATLPSSHHWPHRCLPRTQAMLVALVRRRPCEGNTTNSVAASLHSKSLSGVLVRSDRLRGCQRNRMPLSPFVPASGELPVTGSSLQPFADGSRLPCRAHWPELLPAAVCLSLRSKHRWRFRASPNQATLPHYGFSCEMNRTNFTLPTKQSTELLHTRRPQWLPRYRQASTLRSRR